MRQTTIDYLSAACLASLVQNWDPDAASIIVSTSDMQKSLGSWLGLDVPLDQVEWALHALEDAQTLLGYHDKYAESRYERTTQSKEIYGAEVADTTSIVFKIEKLGKRWLKEALTNVLAKEAEQRASEPEVEVEDIWEPLPVDRSSVEYIEAIQSLEEATTAIEQHNGFAASEPDKRNAVVESLRSGIDWLKSKSPTREQIRAFILAPLKYVAKKFGDSSVGHLAKRAIEAIVSWLF